MQYVADVAASLPQTSQSTSGGLFRFTWRSVKSYGLTLGLRTVFLYLPQPVAACMIVLPPGGSLPALAQVTLPVHPPHPFTYLAASWKVDVEHTPAPDFTRWYMSRVTCGTFLLEVCQRCKVCPNLVAHLQIPRMRISYQVAMPVVGKPGQHAVPRRPDGAFFESGLVPTTSIANAQGALAATGAGDPSGTSAISCNRAACGIPPAAGP